MDLSQGRKGPQGYVVIHGHFYQPPRENPWIEEIEEEPGAQPFHDWNSRIAAECYTPNSCARIYDGQGRILDIVNNYEFLSFNFGPTLLSWLEDKAPLTYQRILAADRQSRERLGHGNALAQAYNHAILPLATARDRETQVIWGLEDFAHRFRRQAEAMWLPETAVDYPTLATLVEQGLKFVLLSPYQAQRVRPMGGGGWQPVEAYTLDTTQAYRCYLPGKSADLAKRQYIDVFFYNHSVASDLSFGDLLKDSYALADRLVLGFSHSVPRPQLFTVATDGENYGHHKKFGELALAHTLAEALPHKGFSLINYAKFLELAPPQMQVEINLGPKGQGSSWSCAHGVGRWQEDCGCSTGSQPNWNQKWRAPLRKALDFLNEKLAAIFTTVGENYFQDPWAARNAYIQVILDRHQEVLRTFFARQGKSGLTPNGWAPALKLLEMQRQALLMYTSCGWFFADLAGLETLQVLKYAGRALQLGQDFTPEALEPAFLEHLEKAVSNVPREGNGRQIFTRRVKPGVVDFAKIVNQWSITYLKERERQCLTRIFFYRVEPLDYEVKTQASMTLSGGRLRLTSEITQETQSLGFFTVHLGSYLYRTQVIPQPASQEFFALKQELFQVLEKTPEDLMPLMARRLGERYYTVHDIFQDIKETIFQDLLHANRQEALAQISHYYEEAKPLLTAMTAENLALPRLYRALAEITLNRRLVELLRRLEPQPDLLPASDEIMALITEAAQMGLKLESGEGAQILARILSRYISNLEANFTSASATQLQEFLLLLNSIPITVDLMEAQNSLFALMTEHFPGLAARVARDPEALRLAENLVVLLEALYFSPIRYFKLLA